MSNPAKLERARKNADRRAEIAHDFPTAKNIAAARAAWRRYDNVCSENDSAPLRGAVSKY
jgi:hypothetical protein